MSKHVWRGIVEGKTPVKVAMQGWGENGCTVIEDAACFPVKEAMRLIAVLLERKRESEFYLAVDKYERAVARMKAKKGKK